MIASDLFKDPSFLSLPQERQHEVFLQRLGEQLQQFYTSRKPGRAATDAWRDVAGMARSEVFQYDFERILSSVNIRIEQQRVLDKLCAARHAGLSNEALGEIFCRERDRISESP